MSEFSLDDLPEGIRKVIEEMLTNMSIMQPEELMDVFGEVFGEDILDQIQHLFQTGGAFSFVMDEYTLNKFEKILNEMEIKPTEDFVEEEIEPYYEITTPLENKGEIIVELPGVNLLSQIDWYEFDDEIYIFTVDTIENYKLIIPVPKYFKINEEAIVFRNGLFIIPYYIAG